MRAFKFVVPVMIIVAWVSWYMLDRNHEDVVGQTRVFITIGAVVLSGVISFFLFPKDDERE